MSTDSIRSAVGSAVIRTSIRRVVRDVGMSAPGLTQFLEGGTPREKTLRKLREWYFSEAGTRSDITETTARAAMEVLVEPIAARHRGRAREQIVEVLVQAHRRQGTAPPQWLHYLQDTTAPARDQ